MRTVVFAARKGGASKTTLTGHLAVEAARRGRAPIVLMDTDPQQLPAAWWQEREADEPRLAALSQHGPIATAIMHYRVDYAGAMTDGRTVQEIDPHGNAAEEIGHLFDYVDTQLRMHDIAEMAHA